MTACDENLLSCNRRITHCNGTIEYGNVLLFPAGTFYYLHTFSKTQQDMTVAPISCQILFVFSSAINDKWGKSNDRYSPHHMKRGRKIAYTSDPLV